MFENRNENWDVVPTVVMAFIRNVPQRKIILIYDCSLYINLDDTSL